jgi:hypothetical protein
MDDPAPTPQGPTHPPPSTPPPKPAKTPGPWVPVVPTLVNGAAGLAATVGTLGAATGGAGVMAAAAAVGLGGGALVARNRPAAARMLRRTVTQTRTQRQRTAQARGVARRAAATRKAGVRAASPGLPRRKAKGAARVAASRARSAGALEKRKASGAKRAAAVNAAGVRRAEVGQRKAQARVAKAAQRAAARGTTPRPGVRSGRLGGFPKISGRGARAGRKGAPAGGSGRRTPVARAQRRNQRAQVRRAKLGKIAATGRAKVAARRARLGQKATSRANDRDARRSHLRARKTANRVYRRRSFAARLTTFGRRRLERLAALRDQYMAALDDIDATYGQGVSLVAPLSEENRATPLGFIQTVPYINGGTMTDQFNFLGITEDMMHAAQAGDMDGALNLLHLAEQMPTVFTNIANAFVTVASRTNDEMPIGPETRAAFEEVASAVQRIVDAAEQVAPTMRREHEADIERLENPRTGEEKWDVANNG